MLAHADFIGSTSALIKRAIDSPATKLIIATEPGVIHEMRKRAPGKEFIPLRRGRLRLQRVPAYAQEHPGKGLPGAARSHPGAHPAGAGPPARPATDGEDAFAVIAGAASPLGQLASGGRRAWRLLTAHPAFYVRSLAMSGSLAVNAGSTPLDGCSLPCAPAASGGCGAAAGCRGSAGAGWPGCCLSLHSSPPAAVKLIFSAATGPLELVQPLWRVLAVNQLLQLGVGLCLDASAAIFLGGAALLGAWAVCTESPERAGWIGGACLATAVGLQGDSLVLRLAGWEALTVASYLLSQKPNKAALGLGRAGDAMLLALRDGAAVLGLSGSWSSSRLDAHQQLDYRPPQGSAAGAAADASTQTATAPQFDPGASAAAR